MIANPVFLNKETIQTKPQLTVLIDNSLSVSIEKPIYKGTSDLNKVLEHVRKLDSTNVSFRYYSFDHSLHESSLDDLLFDGTATDLNLAISQIRDSNLYPDGVILISDGIFNKGRDPYLNIINLDIPFYVVALGDSIKLRDIFISDVLFPNNMFTNSDVVLIPQIVNYGFPDSELNIELYANNELVSKKNIVTSEDRSVHFPEFIFSPDASGFTEFKFVVTPLDGEWTIENNSFNFSAQIVDGKTKVLHLVFEIHPDAHTVRSILSKDPSIELINRTWIRDSYFAEGYLPVLNDSIDVVIIQGYPARDITTYLTEYLNQITVTKSYWYINTPASLLSPLNGENSYSNSVLETSLSFSKQHQSHPIINILETDISRSPVLYTREYVNGKPDFQGLNLIESSTRTGVENIPIFIANETGNIRKLYQNYWGFSSWFRNADIAYNEILSELINNSIRWVSNQSSDDLMEIHFSQSSYTESDPISIRASIKNESGDPEINATVDLSVEIETEKRIFRFNSSGFGNYSLGPITLPMGTYPYNITSTRNNQLIAEINGMIRVESGNLEYLESRQNETLLRNIALATNGSFLDYSQVDSLQYLIQNAGFDTIKLIEIKRPVYLYKYPYWFMLLVLFICIEWLIRKLKNLP